MSGDVKGALAELNRKVLGKPGVSGTAVGGTEAKPVLMVYLSEASAGKLVPSRVAGVPVKVEVSGPFKKY